MNSLVEFIDSLSFLLGFLVLANSMTNLGFALCNMYGCNKG